MPQEQFVIQNISQNILTLTLNRPEQLNALNNTLIKELHLVLKDTASKSNIRAIILTGSGTKAFVAGADIKEFAHLNATAGKDLAKKGQQLLFDYIAQYPKPVIAAINGYALGGGLELALACHIRIATDTAQFGLPEVKLGLIPGYGGTQRLTQIVGKGKALEMILTARFIDAQEALQAQLITKVVPVSNLMDTCMALAEKIALNAPNALKNAILAVEANYSQEGLTKEIALFGACFGTPDFIEGTQAFIEKRKANFD